jgi:hypothetical protein
MCVEPRAAPLSAAFFFLELGNPPEEAIVIEKHQLNPFDALSDAWKNA